MSIDRVIVIVAQQTGGEWYQAGRRYQHSPLNPTELTRKERNTMRWQAGKEMITPPQEMPLVQESLPNNEPTDEEIGAQVSKQIGLLLTQCSCLASYVMFVEWAALSSLVTPVTEVLLQSAYLGMANHIMNTSDLLRILTYTSQDWPKITPNRDEMRRLLETVKAFLEECERSMLDSALL